ncbi:MAG: Ig-like domain-containing protein [Clostridiales bacterium]|nr:Ig-like domain-containing protein [Clostridiales bacterium]
MGKHSLKKITSFILILSLILAPFLGNIQSAYAGTEEEQQQINAWFDTNGKIDEPKNLLFYQDSVNAVFDLLANKSPEEAWTTNLSQAIRTLTNDLNLDPILDIISIVDITIETYDGVTREQKIKYDLSELKLQDYQKYIPSIVDRLSEYAGDENENAFTKYAGDHEATDEYCNAVVDLLRGIREGVTRVDEATWENEWAVPSAHDYESQVNAIVTAYTSGEGMAAAVNNLVTELKGDTSLLDLSKNNFTDLKSLNDVAWDNYNKQEHSCERKTTDFLYSMEPEKLQNGGFDEYVGTFQKRIKANLIDQESAFGNYFTSQNNDSIGWAIQDLISELYQTVKDVDEKKWEYTWVSPSAYDYETQVDAIVAAYNTSGEGMTEAVDQLVTELKKDSTLSELYQNSFTDLKNLKDDEAWDNYYKQEPSCERVLTDYLYSIDAKKLESNSYKYYVEFYQKRLKEHMEEQKNHGEEERSALYRYMNGDKNCIGWAIQDLIQALFDTVRDMDEATWESEFATPSAHNYESQVNAIVAAYKNSGEGMTEAVDQLVTELKKDSTLLELYKNGFTDLKNLKDDEAWDNYYKQEPSCERQLTDYLYSIDAKNLESNSYKFYVDLYQRKLKDHMEEQEKRGEDERSALYRYMMNDDKKDIGWAIHDLIQELFHTVRDIDEAPWESEFASPSAYDYQEIMQNIRRVYSTSETELTQAVDQLITALKADGVIQKIKANGITDFSKLQTQESWDEYWSQESPCEKRIADYLYNMKANKMQGESYTAYMNLLQKKLKDIIINDATVEEDRQSALYRYLNGKDDELPWAISDIVIELYYTVQEIDNPISTPSDPIPGPVSTPEPTATPTPSPTVQPTETVKKDEVVGEDNSKTTTTIKTTIDENGNTKVEENKVVTDKDGKVKETVVTSKVEDKETGTSIETVLKKDGDGSLTDATTTVQTAIESKVTEGKAEIDIITPEKALLDTTKDTELERPLDVTIKLPEKKIIEQLASSDVKEAEIKIPISSEITNKDKLSINNINLSKEILASAKENGINIKIAVTDEKGKEKYSMSFDSGKLENSKKKLTDINLNLDIKQASQSSEVKNILKIDTNNKENDAVVLDFSHSGVLPVTMTVNVYVGEQKNLAPGTKVFMYYMNPNTSKLDRLPNNEYTVSNDLFVKVNVNHCSEYVLLPNEVSKEVQADLLDQISIAEKKTLYLGGTKGNYVTLKPVMPSTIEKVSKFDTIKDEAVSEVKVSYATDNKKVVRVNKSTGKVVAAGTGKATVTTTFKLANGEQKVLKTVVTVKKPSIKITSNTTTYKVGKAYQLTAKTYGLKGNVSWSVSDKSVVVINKATGKIRVRKAGTAIVTATCGEVKKTFKIVVK